MAINLAQEITNSLENQGGVTTDTTLGGDLSGSLPNPTVTKVQNISIPSTGYADGLGWRYSSGQMILTTLLNEDSNFTGDVSGSQASGLTVNSLSGTSLEVGSPSTGQIIKFNGSNWALSDDSGGFTVMPVSVSTTATGNKKVFVDTTASAITITCPSSPTEGTNFLVYDSFGNCGTNAITIDVPSGDSIESSVDDTLLIDVNNAVIEMYYNGSTWKYYVISVRP